MLQQFTWQQFLTAAAILSISWYAAVLLLYFRPEIRALFSGRRMHPPEKPADGPPSIPDGEDDGLMGPTVLPEGVETVGDDDFSFAGMPGAEAKTRRLGVVSDVMQELKNITGILEKENGTKEDFYSLFALVRERYPSIRESGQLEALTAYLVDYLPFGLTDEEKQNLWNEPNENSPKQI